jgi:F-type H+-transporting ATPase subunit b
MSRRCFRSVAAVCAALLLFPTLAFAKEGMPQLDFANPLTKGHVYWGAGIFLVLYLLVSRWGLPQVASVLDERASKIAGDLEAARAAKVNADAAVAELTDATQRARAEAQAAINRAADKAKQIAATQSAELNAKLDAQLAEAEGRIAAARGSAVHALRQVARETADTMITRLTGTQPDTQTLDRAVAAALAARAQG